VFDLSGRLFDEAHHIHFEETSAADFPHSTEKSCELAAVLHSEQLEGVVAMAFHGPFTNSKLNCYLAV